MTKWVEVIVLYEKYVAVELEDESKPSDALDIVEKSEKVERGFSSLEVGASLKTDRRTVFCLARADAIIPMSRFKGGRDV